MNAHLSQARAPSVSSLAPAPRSLLQRKYACGGTPGPTGECVECSNRRLGLQRKTADRAGTPPAPPIVHDVIHSPGRPLDERTRGFMESRFGHDFSQVRVHTGTRAAESAWAVDAAAYTVGRDVVFGAWRYTPGTADGRCLIAHELAHVVQQSNSSGPGLVIQRQRATRDIHDPLVEAYRRAHGLPRGGVDPTTGERVGPTDAELEYGGELDRWIRQGEVPAPLTKPDVSPVQGPFDEAACGLYVRGKTPAAEAQRISACVYHAQFVNLMNQSISNMRQVASPYAPGLAALYHTLLQQVINEGETNYPTDGSPKSYMVKDVTVAVSSGTSLKIPSFTLKLEQVLNGENGSYGSYMLTLNEVTQDVMLKNQAGLERTMYHEGFHFLSSEVTAANQAARASSPPGNVVRRELDYGLVESFRPEYEAAVTPLWTEALSTIGGVPAADLTDAVNRHIMLHWNRVRNEILARVEEIVYLELREGRGFSPTTWRSFPQFWIRTAAYWPSWAISEDDMQTFLSSKRDKIESDVLPVVQEIQESYLYMRPVR